MLNIMPPAEQRVRDAIVWMRRLDEFQLLLPRSSGPSFELMFLRQLEKLRTYHLVENHGAFQHIGAVSLMTDGEPESLNFSLLWASKEAGSHMNGLLHWSGPQAGVELTTELFADRSQQWEWSTHT